MGCDDCKQNKNVSWTYVELLNDGYKSSLRKLWVLVLVLIVCLGVTNLLWLKAWNEYDYVTSEFSQDGRGINVIGDNNETEQYNDEPACTNKNANP